MNIKALPQMHLRTMILAVFGVILTWLVVSRSLTVYLADVAPQTALWLSPRQPEALVNLADRSLNPSENTPVSAANIADQAAQGQNRSASGSTRDLGAGALGQAPEGQNSTSAATDSQNLNYTFETVGQNRSVDLATVRDWAKSALMNDPLNARAVRILGQLADAAGDRAASAKFMETAAQLSLHESVAVYWLMLKSTEAGDYKTAISDADALLRTNRNLGPYVAPLLTHFAENKASNGLVKAVLDNNPPWRDLFFASLLGGVSDVRTPLDLLLSLKTSQAPPSSREIGDYLSFLMAHNFYDLAYYAWLQFLPAEQLSTAGLLFNGNFENDPSGLPFDWVITPGSGVTIDIVPRPDKNEERALSVDFLYGRVDYHSVSELVLLAPGTYQFNGKYKGQIVGPRGLKWRLECAVEQTRIGESSMISGVASTWKDIEFTFTVPATDCRAQYVRLDLDARMASEHLITGTMLFTELQISRETDEPDSQ